MMKKLTLPYCTYRSSKEDYFFFQYGRCYHPATNQVFICQTETDSCVMASCHTWCLLNCLSGLLVYPWFYSKYTSGRHRCLYTNEFWHCNVALWMRWTYFVLQFLGFNPPNTHRCKSMQEKALTLPCRVATMQTTEEADKSKSGRHSTYSGHCSSLPLAVKEPFMSPPFIHKCKRG